MKSEDFPCYVDVYDQKKVDPVRDGYKLDEVVWVENMMQYLHWVTNIDAPMGHTRGSV